MKSFITWLLSGLTLTVNAQYVSQINDPLSEGAYNYNSVMTADKLIYPTRTNELNMLWSYDHQSGEKQLVYSTAGDMSLIHNYDLGVIYFTAPCSDGGTCLWQTEGTPASTRMVSQQQVGRGNVSIIQGQLLVVGAEGTLMQLINGELVDRGIEVFLAYETCLFDEQNLVAIEYRVNQSPNRILQNNQGTITEVLTFQPDFSYNTHFISYQGHCYLHYLEQNVWKIIRLAADGSTLSFNETTGLPASQRVFVHQDRLYATSGTDDPHDTIHRLTEDLSGTDASLQADSGHSFLYTTSNNQLIVATIERHTGTGYRYQAMDADLNEIPAQVTDYSNWIHGGGRAFFSDVILARTLSGQGTLLETINPDNQLSSYIINNLQFIQMVSHPLTDVIYMGLGGEPTAGEPALYKLTPQPVINDLLDGSWHDPAIHSQGLVVQRGQRPDGSQYLFTTLYTYLNGEPLWLAGNTDVLTAQSMVTVDLYQFSGIGLFESGATPENEAIATMTLQLTQCNKLAVELVVDGQSLELLMQRIDDNSAEFACFQAKPVAVTDNQPANNTQGGES
jgi:ELWxxDGT repeat protein